MQKRRNLELDLFKLLLVVGMIAAHVFQLLHNGKSNGSMIWMFSTYINAITFSGFLLAFGCATQLAYLRKTKDKILRGKLMRNGIRLLIAFYISGLAYTFFVSHNLGMMETIKILCLWQIPGYSEFLLSFAMLMPMVWVLYQPLNTVCNHTSKWGVICLTLISTLIPYRYVVIPLLGVLVGTTKFACFPLLQYSIFYLSGIYIAKRGMRVSRMMLYISFLLTGIAVACTLVIHKIPNRFPPSFFWIILPSAPLAIYWVCLGKIKDLKIISKYKNQIGIYGNNMLDYLVLSNVLIFLAQYLLGKCLDSVQCIMMIIAILLCCVAYTHVKLKIWHNQ